MTALDDLELELRKLPGVHAAGFEERDDVLIVQLHVGPDRLEEAMPVAATKLAAKHADGPVAVEVVRWRDLVPEPAPVPAMTAVPAPGVPLPAPGGAAEAPRAKRPRLLAVLSFPDTDELEVHLILEGRRTIGRAAASRTLTGAAEATVEAVRGLGVPITPVIRWARQVEGDNAMGKTLVAVALDGVEEGVTHHGLAGGDSPLDAAARATLDALNRRISRLL